MKIRTSNPAYDCNEKLYRVWNGMKNRCTNSNDLRYKYYGGKGLSVCREWSDCYQTFRDWSYANGYTEEGVGGNRMSIERKDNSKGYNPDNCTYIPLKDQHLNQAHRKPGPKINRHTKSESNREAMRQELLKCDASLLSPVERELRELFLKGNSITEIAKIRGVTRQRIHQLIHKVLSRERGVSDCYTKDGVKRWNERKKWKFIFARSATLTATQEAITN